LFVQTFVKKNVDSDVIVDLYLNEDCYFLRQSTIIRINIIAENTEIPRTIPLIIVHRRIPFISPEKINR